MRYGKKQREAFQWKVLANRKLIMPYERMKKQVTLFDEELQQQEFYRLEFILFYPDVENKSKYELEGEKLPNIDPQPKQSYRTYLAHTSEVIGKDLKGEPLYKQYIKGYQDSKVVEITSALEQQIKIKMRDDYPDFKTFTKDVHITRMEFIHHVPAVMSKRDLELVKKDEELFFKYTLPDVDNLQKMLYDALKKTNVMKDDGQIASVNGLVKCYGMSPCVILELEGRL